MPHVALILGVETAASLLHLGACKAVFLNLRDRNAQKGRLLFDTLRHVDAKRISLSKTLLVPLKLIFLTKLQMTKLQGCITECHVTHLEIQEIAFV